jgi:hypothetical protein
MQKIKEKVAGAKPNDQEVFNGRVNSPGTLKSKRRNCH